MQFYYHNRIWRLIMKKFWAFLVVGLLIGSAAWAVDVQISASVPNRLSVAIEHLTWNLTIG